MFTPLTWAAIRACGQPERLVFAGDNVLSRVDSSGDILADLADARAKLPAR